MPKALPPAAGLAIVLFRRSAVKGTADPSGFGRTLIAEISRRLGLCHALGGQQSQAAGGKKILSMLGN